MIAADSQTRRAIPTCFARRVSLSRAEVAETLGCSQDFVDSLIEDGKLHAIMLRKRVFIPAAQVWALMGLTKPVRRATAEDRALLRKVGVG